MPSNYDKHVDHLALSGITLLGSETIDMKTAASTTIFTPERSCRILRVVVRNPSATLVGGSSYTLTNFRAAFSLVTLTSTTGYLVVQATDLTQFTEVPAGTAVQLTVTTGSTAAATATVDVFGYYI